MFTACYSMSMVSPFRKQRAWLFPYVLSARSDVLTAVDDYLGSELLGPLGGQVSLSHWRWGSMGPGTCPFVMDRSKISSPCRDTQNYVLDTKYIFFARSHTREKHLLPSARLSVHPSVGQFRPHAPTWVPVDEFWSRFILGTSTKMYPENPYLVTIRQKYRQLYTETKNALWFPMM
jgi:hypothetical protein